MFLFWYGGRGRGGKGVRWYPNRPPVCMCSIVREQFVILLFSFLFALSPSPLFFWGGESLLSPSHQKFFLFFFFEIYYWEPILYVYVWILSEPPPWWFERKMKKKIYDELHKSRPPPHLFSIGLWNVVVCITEVNGVANGCGRLTKWNFNGTSFI